MKLEKIKEILHITFLIISGILGFAMFLLMIYGFGKFVNIAFG